MENDAVLSCSVNLQWCNAQGSVQRKITHKIATLRLGRNEFKDIFVEINAEKATSIKLKLKGITVHNKFTKEGKASIKFQDDKCIMLLANAAPSQLNGFLRCIFIKMTGEKASGSKASLREQLLSNKPKSFEEISPITTAEVNKVMNKISKATDTTPSPLSRKRKMEHDKNYKVPAAKKLYADNHNMTDEQKRVYDSCLSGVNVFFTGSAGTGKSFLLQKIIAALPPHTTVATASTVTDEDRDIETSFVFV
ncbi:hypothetical protein FQA39_LY04271 [Lamprigera yunnana]|nr:hypothetical protein FQA39_LY04271 [Lamprigera yunnana]